MKEGRTNLWHGSCDDEPLQGRHGEGDNFRIAGGRREKDGLVERVLGRRRICRTREGLARGSLA